MYEKIAITLALCVLLMLSAGCYEYARTPDSLDALLSTVNSLATANVASAPVNPYAIPIGVGLSGLIGILEALRRQEKSGRKHAEQELNANNSHT